jgi:peptidoglycan-associated lipoprotein
MRKLLVRVGMVVLVSAVGGVSACGKSDKTKAKTPVAQTADAVAHNAADVKLAASEPSATVHSEPGVFETAPKPRVTLELAEGKSGFKFRSAMLSDEAKAKIDAMFSDDTVDFTNAHFEIEGYTDNLGSKEVNDQMARARGKAVKEYLGEEYGIAGDCIHVVSYGMENPVGDNSTPEGRARNRRVVIKVVD